MVAVAEKKYRLVKTNLNSQIYGVLKEMIADQRFSPGTYINVEGLTHELGVSRTPIWEAIRRLEQEGIVVHTPHKGVRVREFTREMAVELYLVREALEVMAARLAAERVSDEALVRLEQCLERQAKVIEKGDAVGYSKTDYQFHKLIYQASGNQLLSEMLDSLRYKALPLAFGLNPFFSEFLGFHREILTGLRRRDPDRTEKAVRRHFQRMHKIIADYPWEEQEPQGARASQAP
ncbi:MAG: GntR family transcriptional regulator [Desulfarculus sp.]|jgi:DNA-binding GntR family transcriptional regulator|nr:MAG: GntR family transcriptional regulator [Desulfarculus sp.]